MLNTIIKEIKELKADKKIWIGILTVLIIFIIGTSYNTEMLQKQPDGALKIGVINHDESPYSKLLISYFNNSDTIKGLITLRQEESGIIKDAFSRGELDLYLEIPKDFASNMMKIENVPIRVTLNTSDKTKAVLIENLLKSYGKYITAVEKNAVGLYEIMEEDGVEQGLIDKANREISLELIFTALGKETFFSFQPLEQFPAADLFHYYTTSLLVTAILYLGLYAGYTIQKEGRQGTLTRIRTTMLSMYQFLAAKIAVLTLVLSTFSTIAVFMLYQKPFSLAEIIFSLAVSLFGICLSVFLSSFLNSRGFLIAGNLFLFFCTLLGGGIIPVSYLPSDLVLLSKLTPNYYMLKGFLNIYQEHYEGISSISTVLILLSLLLMCISSGLIGRGRTNYEEA
jgi:ABC-2 type transport system permease protein